MRENGSNALENLYKGIEYVNPQNMQDSKDVAEAIRSITDFAEKKLSHEDFMKLDELTGTLAAEADRQGFKNGFRYAVSLFMSCGIGGVA